MKRDTLLAVNEGKARILFANKKITTFYPKPEEDFKKPTFLYTEDQKASITVYYGGKKKYTIQRLIVMGVRGADSDRIARTAIYDGEYRRAIGRNPRTIVFSIGFYDTLNEPWFNDFMQKWEKDMRPSVLQENKGAIYVKVGDCIYKGMITAIEQAKTVEDMLVTTCSMQFDVDDIIYINPAVTQDDIDNMSSEVYDILTYEKIL